MGRLDDRVVVITGATGAIGRATTALLVREGARVVAVGRRADLLEEAVAPHGDRAVPVVADVTEEDQVARAFAEARERFGRVDVAFANAGVEGVIKPLAELPVEELDAVYAVNVRGTFLTIKHAAPAMVGQGSGSIVVISSVLGTTGFAGLGAYVMSKHAIAGLMKTAALELAPLGVRVNSIHPAPVDNRMMRSIESQVAPDAPAAAKTQLTQLIPMGRYCTNDEVAHMVLFLASDESSFCTGGVFTVDGAFGAI